MIDQIETHTDGTLWVRCSSQEPKPGKLYNGLIVYHPDARDMDGGQDAHMVCPNCKDSWWIECDG